jgi:hypothetical protein
MDAFLHALWAFIGANLVITLFNVVGMVAGFPPPRLLFYFVTWPLLTLGFWWALP